MYVCVYVYPPPLQVIVDDRIPCKKSGEPAYGHNADRDEYWVAILEKAYAKLHGSYARIDGEHGGNIRDALVDLTGGVPELFFFHNKQHDIRSAKLFDTLMGYRKQGHLLGCGWVATGKPHPGASLGIVKDHAYAILDIRLVEGNRLLQLRNPYGTGEWSGAWGAGSEVWTPSVAAKLGWVAEKNKNNGIFWIMFDDWVRAFNILHIVKLLPSPKWKKLTRKGSW